MILMRVLTVVSEYEVRRNGALQVFKSILYFSTFKRHETVSKILQQRPSQATRIDKQSGRAVGLRLADPMRTEHHPVEHAMGILLPQPKNGAATADLDVIRMAAQTQNG